MIPADGRRLLSGGVNGLSLQRIEARCQPLKDKREDENEWRFRSFNGFLRSGETLAQVIQADADTVSQLSLTHATIAALIRRAISQAKQPSEVFVERNFTYSPPSDGLFTSTGIKQTFPPQPLKVTRTWYCGDQYSVFYNMEKNNNNNHSQFPGDDAADDDDDDSVFCNQKWNVEYSIMNQNNQLEIKVGGDEQSGVVTYIEKFGFYEGGGVQNPYRLDPHLILAVLTGVVTPQVVSLVTQSMAEQVKTLQLRIEANQHHLQLSQNNDEKEWLEARVQQELKSLQELKENQTQQLSRLKTLMT